LTGFPQTHQTLVNLIGLQPQLPPVVLRALQLTTVGFSVYDGLRTPDDQAKAVAAGNSKTSHSRHLTGHAVDFYATVNGKAEWNDPRPYCQIALAFKQASIELNIPLVWGACWDRLVTDLSDNPIDDIHAYRSRQAALGNHAPLIDLDHIELDRHTYP
jgi:peptidoglycan LD-endopeptidase CwlK